MVTLLYQDANWDRSGMRDQWARDVAAVETLIAAGHTQAAVLLRLRDARAANPTRTIAELTRSLGP